MLENGGFAELTAEALLVVGLADGEVRIRGAMVADQARWPFDASGALAGLGADPMASHS